MSSVNSRQGSFETLTPESRISLQMRLSERKKELEEKRQKTLRLQKQEEELTFTPSIPSIHEAAKAQTILSEIRQKMSEISISPAPSSPVTNLTKSSLIDSPKEAKSVTKDAEISPFKIHKSPEVDSIIIPKVVTAFDKSIQADDYADLGEFDEQAPHRGHIVTPTEEEPYLTKPTTHEIPLHLASQDFRNSNEEIPVPVKEMSNEEKSQILESRKFLDFFENSSRILERTLGAMDMPNIMLDITGESGEVMMGDTHKLKRLQKYHDQKITQGRHINDVRCSKIFDEIFLTAFGPQTNLPTGGSNGCVLIWNMAMASRPEYVLTYQSEVCSALFNTFQPKTIIGGTYAGTIILWDLRARSKPVQRTPFSNKGHLFPVYAAELVGTQNAHNLVTMDTDGKICQWSLSMMNQPTEMIMLEGQPHQIGYSGCFAFPEGEINSLSGGMIDGTLFQAQITGSNAGATKFFSAHTGPLTDTNFHPSSEGRMDFTDLLLTSSLDWTVHLWSPKNIQKPLHTFEYEDAVYNAKWHPTHPSIFATSESTENISIWNINYSFQKPVFTTSADNAVNKLCWSNDGKRLYTGDNQGELIMWGASTDIFQCKNEDWEKMISSINELKKPKDK